MNTVPLLKLFISNIHIHDNIHIQYPILQLQHCEENQGLRGFLEWMQLGFGNSFCLSSIYTFFNVNFHLPKISEITLSIRQRFLEHFHNFLLAKVKLRQDICKYKQ